MKNQRKIDAAIPNTEERNRYHFNKTILRRIGNGRFNISWEVRWPRVVASPSTGR